MDGKSKLLRKGSVFNFFPSILKRIDIKFKLIVETLFQMRITVEPVLSGTESTAAGFLSHSYCNEHLL